MAQESARGALAGNIDAVGKSRDLVYCPACGGTKVYRQERKGILQRKMFPVFGFYPWLCKECGNEVLLRKRDRRRSKAVKACAAWRKAQERKKFLARKMTFAGRSARRRMK